MAKGSELEKNKHARTEAEPFILVKANGRIISCNEAFVELLGYSQDELKELRWDIDLTPPEWVNGQREAMKNIAATDHPNMYVKEYIRKDGKRIAVEQLINAIKDRRGEVQYYYVFVREIKEQNAKMDVQRKIERGYFSLMGHWPVFAYRCVNDKDWSMKWIHGDFKEITGYDIEEVIDNKVISWGKIIHPDDIERTWDVARVGINEGRPFQQEYRIITKDGIIKWVLEMNIGVVNSKGEEFFEGFITDITVRKQAEEELKSILFNCHKTLKEQYRLSNKVIYDLQALAEKEPDSELIRQCIKTMLCIQSRTCRLIDSVYIDFDGLNKLAQEIEFIFDGKSYFYPKITSIFSDRR